MQTNRIIIISNCKLDGSNHNEGFLKIQTKLFVTITSDILSKH